MSEVSEEEAQRIIEEYVAEESSGTIPLWVYLFVFTVPAISTFVVMNIYLEIDTLLSGVTSLAIMNGSINSIIAWLTIRLDGQSAEALDH